MFIIVNLVFLFLLRSLRLDDVTDRNDRWKTDKQVTVREFQKDFVKNCQNSCSVEGFVTIDEILVAFHGTCDFIQYMLKNQLYMVSNITNFVKAKHFIPIALNFTVVSNWMGNMVIILKNLLTL